MTTETTETGEHPALDDYEAGRADYAARRTDIERAVRSEDYRRGQQDERTAQGDAELLAWAERNGLPVPDQLAQGRRTLAPDDQE